MKYETEHGPNDASAKLSRTLVLHRPERERERKKAQSSQNESEANFSYGRIDGNQN